MLEGKALEAINHCARDDTDLIVVGTNGRPAARSIFGSSSNDLVHQTPCDLLAVRISGDRIDREATSYRHVLAAVDLSESAYRVVDHAARVAIDSAAEFSICHVSHKLGVKGREADEARLQQFAERFGLASGQIFELSGNTGSAIRDLADEIGADLMVVGAHGRHGLELLSGSTTDAILDGAKCDALVVRVH